MKCIHCGEDNSEDARFCKSCGLELISQLPSSFSSAKPKRHFFSGLGGTAVGILSIIVVYAVINGILWFGQEVYYHEDDAQLSQMESRINESKSKLASFESRMQAYGVTELEYKNYERMIEEHNKLVEEYNTLAKDAGTRWYVVPVPAGHTKSSTK